MLSNTKLARIIQLRGLGWQEKEIAKEVGVGVKTVSYHLRKLRRESQQNQDVFWEIMCGAGVSWISGKLRKLEKIEKLI